MSWGICVFESGIGDWWESLSAGCRYPLDMGVVLCSLDY